MARARHLSALLRDACEAADFVASFPVVGLKLAVGLGFLMPWAFEIYLLGLVWCVGISGYLFSMILLESAKREVRA